MEVQPQQNVITAPEPQVDHVERHGYLFGYPVAHSFSPLFHNTVFEQLGMPWDFQLLESTDMSQFLRLIKDDRLYGTQPSPKHVQSRKQS